MNGEKGQRHTESVRKSDGTRMKNTERESEQASESKEKHFLNVLMYMRNGIFRTNYHYNGLMRYIKFNTICTTCEL